MTGSSYNGIVANIADYGVFVDLGDNVEGLVRTSELNWTNKNINPNKVVNLGDEIQVKVIEIDNEKRRVSLSHKQCLDNPWSEFAENNNEKKLTLSESNNISNKSAFKVNTNSNDCLKASSNIFI